MDAFLPSPTQRAPLPVMEAPVGRRGPRSVSPAAETPESVDGVVSEGPSAATIRAAGAGDELAQTEVVNFLYPIVLRFLRFRFSALRGGVEDATQECMIEIIRSLKHYRGDGTLRSWALKLSFRTARRHRDRVKRHEGPSEDELPESVFSVDPADRGLAVDLLRALRQVTPKKRDALVLTEVVGLTAVEASRVLGTLENTVRSRARHAKAELRELLDDGFRDPRPPEGS